MTSKSPVIWLVCKRNVIRIVSGLANPDWVCVNGALDTEFFEGEIIILSVKASRDLILKSGHALENLNTTKILSYTCENGSSRVTQH